MCLFKKAIHLFPVLTQLCVRIGYYLTIGEKFGKISTFVYDFQIIFKKTALIVTVKFYFDFGNVEFLNNPQLILK